MILKIQNIFKNLVGKYISKVESDGEMIIFFYSKLDIKNWKLNKNDFILKSFKFYSNLEKILQNFFSSLLF